ncbi:membrane-spanning 4-domains subfamily A member 4A-like isoform 1-T2 [Anableps anableps]
MTSTSVTTVGGVVIVTQVIPKDDLSIPLETPANPTVQAVRPVVKTPPPVSQKESKDTIFLRGEPLGLGVVQIIIGVLCVLFSLLVLSSKALILYVPFGLGVLFVMSGSLALAAGRRTSVGLVWVSLASNGFSVLLGLAGVIYVCFLLASGPPSQTFCNFQNSDIDYPSLNITSETVDKWKKRCPSELWRLDKLLYGLQGVFLVLLVLQVCVSVTVCVFSGIIIRKTRRYSPMVMEDDDRSENNIQSESP